MNRSILITGVAGTGKSTVSDELNALGHKAFNIEEIDGLFDMVDKRTGEPFEDFDFNDLELVKRLDWLCDKEKLQRLMSENPDGVNYYCGTASNTDDLLPLFNKVFLLTVDDVILHERLRTRISNDFGRTPEIQQWVSSWRKPYENHLVEEGAILIDASRLLSEVVRDIIERSTSI